MEVVSESDYLHKFFESLDEYLITVLGTMRYALENLPEPERNQITYREKADPVNQVPVMENGLVLGGLVYGVSSYKELTFSSMLFSVKCLRNWMHRNWESEHVVFSFLLFLSFFQRNLQGIE